VEGEGIGIISSFVEKERSNISEKYLFSATSANGKNSFGPMGPCPGKKAFASPKKAGVPLF
jgi:hypothetical protein